MDARANGSFARNGKELYPQPVVLETSRVVACLDSRSPDHCPYGLGTSCPLIEVGKSVVRRRWWIAQGVGMAIGSAISALGVWWVYY